MTTVAEIRFRETQPGHPPDGTSDCAQHFGLSGELVASLDGILRPYELTLEYLLGVHERDLLPQGCWPWVVIFFSEEYPLAGHVASLRGRQHNAAMSSYTRHQKIKAGQRLGGVSPLSMVLVRKKGILRVLAEKSPLFRSAWDALRDKADERCWICLSDPPPPEWVAKMACGDDDLYRVHRSRTLDVSACSPSSFADQDMASAYQFGREAFAAASWERCIASLKLVASQDPTMADAWHYLGCAHAELGEHALATVAFGHAAELQPYWIETRLRLAFSLGCRQLYSQSEAGFLHALEIDPFMEMAWYHLAFVCRKAGRNEQAIAAYEHLLELEPRRADSWGGYGFVLLRCGRVAEAVSALKKNVELDPGDVSGWNNLGFAWARLGRCDEAQKAVEVALELDPTASFAWDSLGYTHLRAGRYGKAIEACLKAIEFRPEHPAAWRHLVHAYYGVPDDGKFRSAYAYLKAINPGEAEKTERELAGRIVE